VNVGLPVAFSVLSCVVTAIALVPILLCSPPPPPTPAGGPASPLRVPTREMLRGLVAVSVAIMLDLACTNVALSLISVALQQSIKATSPTATMLVEALYHRTCHHPVLWLVVALICIGPVLISMGSSTKKTDTFFGGLMMVAAVVSGAFKYVFAHAAMKTYKHELGTLGFLLWVEIIVAVMLTPWAIANGEAAELMVKMGVVSSPEAGGASSMGNALLFLGTAALGGVRIYTQFAFLKETSATSIAMSNLAIQALTIILSIIVFNTHLTLLLGLGVTITIVMSSVYAYLKISKVLEPTKRAPQTLEDIGCQSAADHPCGKAAKVSPRGDALSEEEQTTLRDDDRRG